MRGNRGRGQGGRSNWSGRGRDRNGGFYAQREAYKHGQERDTSHSLDLSNSSVLGIGSYMRKLILGSLCKIQGEVIKVKCPIFHRKVYYH